MALDVLREQTIAGVGINATRPVFQTAIVNVGVVARVQRDVDFRGAVVRPGNRRIRADNITIIDRQAGTITSVDASSARMINDAIADSHTGEAVGLDGIPARRNYHQAVDDLTIRRYDNRARH